MKHSEALNPWLFGAGNVVPKLAEIIEGATSWWVGASWRDAIV